MVPMYMKAPEFFVGFSGAITGVIGMGKEIDFACSTGPRGLYHPLRLEAVLNDPRLKTPKT